MKPKYVEHPSELKKGKLYKVLLSRRKENHGCSLPWRSDTIKTSEWIYSPFDNSLYYDLEDAQILMYVGPALVKWESRGQHLSESHYVFLVGSTLIQDQWDEFKLNLIELPTRELK
jgi:hypothetical protein